MLQSRVLSNFNVLLLVLPLLQGHLVLVKFPGLLGLDALELAQGNVAGEELIDLLQSAAFELGNVQACKDDHDDIDSSVDVANLSTEVGVFGVDEVWDGKGRNKSYQDREDTCQKAGLLLDSGSSSLGYNDVGAYQELLVMMPFTMKWAR